MTNITPTSALIQQEAVQFRSAVSESIGTAMGGAINYLLGRDPGTVQLKSQTFSAGTHTFNAPAALTGGFVLVVGYGGGGGGGGQNSGGSMGGGGSNSQAIFVPVTPGGSYTVNTGQGGAGGATNVNGGAGGNSTFAGILVSLGGQGGHSGAVTVQQAIEQFGNGGSGARRGNTNTSGWVGNVTGGQGNANGGNGSTSGSGSNGGDGVVNVIWFENPI